MNYIAITIGPIFDTIRHSRRTREVWAGSYLFSLITKSIIEKIRVDKELQYSELKKYFVMPYIDEALFSSKGVGLFPDRLIFKESLIGKYDDHKFHKDIIEAVINDLSEIIANANRQPKEQILDFLINYLRIDVCFVEVPVKENPILFCSKYLNSIEQQPTNLSEITNNPLPVFFTNSNQNGFLLANYENKDANDQLRFESLVEIATRQLAEIYKGKYTGLINEYLWDKNSKQDIDEKENKDVDGKKKKESTDTRFLEELIKLDRDSVTKEQKHFRSYHKYICVVKADGDKIGKALENIGEDTEKVERLSKNLFDWCKSVQEKINAFGGVPIYLAGDDLLFFAPVVSKDGKENILNLLTTIRSEFITHRNWTGFEPRPTVSFGVSISYYKHPLDQAIEKAEHLLYSEAKASGGNAFSLQFLKGDSDFSFTLRFESDLYNNHLNKLLQYIHTEEKSFVNSVGYKLQENEQLIKQIHEDEQYAIERLELLFKQVFDEKTTDSYLATLRNLVHATYKKPDKPLEKVFSMIRVAKFLNGMDELKN